MLIDFCIMISIMISLLWSLGNWLIDFLLWFRSSGAWECWLI